MSLRSLSLLVLAVLLGTAVSVRWYLLADERPDLGPVDAREALVPGPALEHVPLPVRAEPARPAAGKVPSRSAQGVARRGHLRTDRHSPSQGQAMPRLAPATEGGPAAGLAAPTAMDAGVVGAFQPRRDPL